MENQRIVYIADGGEQVYHYNSNCGGHEMEFEATETEAKQYGYSPCSRCYRATQPTQASVAQTISQPTQDDYRHRCPECGSTNFKVEVYQEDAGSTIVSNTTHRGRAKERGFFTIKQKSKDKQRTVENVTTNTAYKSVMVCQHCGHVWTKKEGERTKAPNESNSSIASFLQKPWVFIVTAIFFPPVALIFIWTIKKDWDQQKKIKWSAIIGVWALLWFIFIITNAEPVEDTETDINNYGLTSSIVDTTPPKEDGKIGDYVVSVKSYRIVKNYDEEPVILVTYSFINNSDDSTSFGSTINHKAYQNGVELSTEIFMSMTVDDYDSTLEFSDIQPGITLDIEVPYVLRDNSAPVEISLTELFSWTGDEAEYIIDITE